MRRASLISVLVLVVLAGIASATCCVNLSGGVTASTPEFDATGCAAGDAKGSYGGAATFVAVPDFLYFTSIQDKAELYQFVGSGNDVRWASKDNSSDLRCNTTTQVAVWTTTPACVCTSGFRYFGKFTVTYRKCPNGFVQTDSASSTVVQCP